MVTQQNVKTLYHKSKVETVKIYRDHFQKRLKALKH